MALRRLLGQDHCLAKITHFEVSWMSEERHLFFSGLEGPLTCIKSLSQLFDLIGGSRFPVNALCVQCMHFYVASELLEHQWHCSLFTGQTGKFNAKLPRGKLRVILKSKDEILIPSTIKAMLLTVQ